MFVWNAKLWTHFVTPSGDQTQQDQTRQVSYYKKGGSEELGKLDYRVQVFHQPSRASALQSEQVHVSKVCGVLEGGKSPNWLVQSNT